VKLVALAAVALALAPAASAAAPVQVAGSLAPDAVLFADPVTANVAVTVDTRRVDPGSVRLHAAFAPYATGPATRTVQRAGSLAEIRLAIPLRCWTAACLVRGKHEPLALPAASVSYRLRTGASRSVAVAWPPLMRYSRLQPSELKADPRKAPGWRGDVTVPPPVSYDTSPGLLHGLFLGGGIALLVAAALLVATLLPGLPRLRRRRGPQLSPLEQALIVLETAWARGAAEQRKALELLAAELETHGEPPLAGRARELAWSERLPAPKTAEGLAASVRGVIESGRNGHG
jgi:hypothetical protein